MQDAFVFTKNAVLSILRLRCWVGEWGAWEESGGWPPEEGVPRKFRAHHWQWLALFPWSSSTCTSLLFLTNQVYIRIKRSLEEALFSFGWKKGSVSNSLTSSPKTAARTCGARRDDCGVQDVPELWLLNPLTSHLRSTLAPLPPVPFRPIPGGRTRPGWHGLVAAGAEEVRKDELVRLAEEPSLSSFLRMRLQNIELLKCQIQDYFPKLQYPRDSSDSRVNS